MEQALMDLVVTAARQAGALIMRYYRPGDSPDPQSWIGSKGINNPVTQADMEANALLQQQLMQATPHYGWLSEESADHASRLDRQRIWIVDPIDGTREFIRGEPQFAVSIGLVEQGQPLLACVYNPARDQMFTAWYQEGSYLNGQPVHVSTRQQLQGACCLSSQSETKRGEWQSYRDELQLVAMGSVAYKLALVAGGQYDLTFTLTPKSEWDVCAGVLLVECSGGRVTDHQGHRHCFNRPVPRLSSLLATNGLLHPALLQRLAHVPLSPDRQKCS
ncbi:MAG: 3'(2'),5'-bisphosphate nucleotidase CysQ [Magnetococcales bacterium]|nr:3'(2'),5'-bisphosphate nucleotidase CysQ [Magnetococcales bacterium]